MGLRDCANDLVGSNRVLFLDEPTSGLDVFTASSIIGILRALADEGRNLFLTVHQSRSGLFKYFNNILLLAPGGSPVYVGKGSLILNHFASLGFECPTTTNPADFALDLITVSLQNATKESTSSLILEWDQSQAPLHQTISHVATPAEWRPFASRFLCSSIAASSTSAAFHHLS
ncbi:hypothetical protein ABVK25_001271 [Lepraria finkii]|uniref:ABC transporter family G domain-containing protein n=1 Tax=Lepraria finkii TaxID=1340010 RepID=A0ABR4BL63_9LECA